MRLLVSCPTPNPEGQGIPFSLDLSGMGGPTSSIRYYQLSSRDHMTTKAPPLRQSRDNFGIKFHVNSDIGSRADTCGQTDGKEDGRDEGHRRFSRLYQCAYKGVAINIRTYEAGWFPLLQHGSPAFHWERVTTAVVEWFTDRT